MTQEDLINIAEDFDKWLEEKSQKFNIDKTVLQEIIKQFLL